MIETPLCNDAWCCLSTVCRQAHAAVRNRCGPGIPPPSRQDEALGAQWVDSRPSNLATNISGGGTLARKDDGRVCKTDTFALGGAALRYTYIGRCSMKRSPPKSPVAYKNFDRNRIRLPRQSCQRRAKALRTPSLLLSVDLCERPRTWYAPSARRKAERVPCERPNAQRAPFKRPDAQRAPAAAVIGSKNLRRGTSACVPPWVRIRWRPTAGGHAEANFTPSSISLENAALKSSKNSCSSLRGEPERGRA
eukprot:353674-Chlamydomonas_euryale.AAC.2